MPGVAAAGRVSRNPRLETTSRGVERPRAPGTSGGENLLAIVQVKTPKTLKTWVAPVARRICELSPQYLDGSIG